MKTQNLLQLPRLIRLARLHAGLSQKVLAGRVGLDQSFLCALEKGRRRVHTRGVLDSIGQAISLTPRQSEELLWAWAHDKVVTEAQSAGLSVAAQRLVSAGLRSVQLLEQDELAGLENTIESALRSKQELMSLAERRTSHEEEVPMN